MAGTLAGVRLVARGGQDPEDGAADQGRGVERVGPVVLAQDTAFVDPVLKDVAFMSSAVACHAAWR